MDYIALIMVAIMWAYFLYIFNLLFRGILNNSDKNYKEYLVYEIASHRGLQAQQGGKRNE